MDIMAALFSEEAEVQAELKAKWETEREQRGLDLRDTRSRVMIVNNHRGMQGVII